MDKGRIKGPGGQVFEFDDDDVLAISWRYEPGRDGTHWRAPEGDYIEICLSLKDKRDGRWARNY